MNKGLQYSVHVQAGLKSSRNLIEMDELTISQVARQAGVRPSTIRYYESIDVLPPARRLNGRRRYDPAILDRLAFIQITQQLGFTLSEIQLLFQHQAEA